MYALIVSSLCRALMLNKPPYASLALRRPREVVRSKAFAGERCHVSHRPAALLPAPLIRPEQRQTRVFRRLASPDTPRLCHRVAVRDQAMGVGAGAAADARRHRRD